MANTIALISKYIALLDEVYKNAALTADLEASSAVVRQGSNANQILVPKMSMDGLADYDRNSGYVEGSETLDWETKTFNYDRGRRFVVDAMDDEETAGISFGMLSAEFIRTKVVPELDAWRFAKYSAKAGNTTSANLTDGNAILGAITVANNTLDEAEVDVEGRYLFITPTLLNFVEALDTYKSKAMLERFAKIVKVPQTRFYTAVDLLSGKKVSEQDDQTIGGYKKASAGKNINFMIVQKSAPIQYTKHVVSKVITPEQNQSSDGWMFFYRAYGLADVYDNKVNGIYVHKSTT